MRRVLCLLLLISYAFKLSAQVHQQTGSAELNLPMFNWQDDKSRLSLSVSLNYNSGAGLKVNDVASNVGQGWNLLAAGVITRMQVGEPDDQKPRDGPLTDITKYPAGYLYATNAASLGAPNAIAKYPIYREKNYLYKQHNIVAEDREMDYFSFQFNGRSGVFILDKNTNQGVPLQENNRLKISFTKNETASSFGFRTTIRTFTIQDENGIIYRFGNIDNAAANNKFLGRTEILKYNYCSNDWQQQIAQPKFKNGKVYRESAFDDNTIAIPYVVSGWYLAEMEDALTHRKVTFNYTVNSIQANSGIDISNYNSDKNYVLLSKRLSNTETPEITSITCSDGHAVQFTYGNLRVDLNNDRVLSSVGVTYSGRNLARYQLNTSYFILNRYGTPISDYEKSVARLCLLSVLKFGVDLKAVESPHYFDYYLGTGVGDDFVPPPFFFAKDVWGYFNGDNSKSFYNSSVNLKAQIGNLSYDALRGLCFIRNGSSTVTLNAKDGYAKNGLLKQVITPTGGTTTFEYQQNSGMLNSQNTFVGGVHVSKTKVTDGGNTYNCSNPIITNYNYILTDNSSSLWGIEIPVNVITASSHYAPESKYYYYKFPFGSCAYRYQYPGIISRDQAINLNAAQKVLVALSKVADIVSVVTTIMDVANVIGGSTGFFAVASVVMDIIGGLVDVALTCFVSQANDQTTTIYYNSDLNAINPLPAQFKRVEVYQNIPQAGKVVNVFTSNDDYSIWVPSNAANLFSSQQRYAYWAYGLPRFTTVFDANNKEVKETEYIYDWTEVRHYFCLNAKCDVYKYPSCKTQINKTSSQRNTDWENVNVDPAINFITGNTAGADIQANIYYALTGWTPLIETKERMYKQNDRTKFQETITDYDYDNAESNSNYQVIQTSQKQSNGDITYTSVLYNNNPTFYPLTQNATGIFKTWADNNIIDIPVETTTSIKKNNQASKVYLDEKVTEYTTPGNGSIKPYRTLVQRFSQPQTSITKYDGTNLGNGNYKETQKLTYDASGNLIGIADEGKHTVSNIYDYNDKYIIASVINSDPLIDKPKYTSFETGTLGFTLNGSPNIIAGNSVTGINYFGLTSSSSLVTSINSAKAYKASFWASNSNVRVNGSAGTVKSTQVINGFSYYEFDIAAGASSVTITGIANIDELRLYPATARMRTVTYDPLIGKTTECDENNRITYYEYDELGRLRFIKDDAKNIVKMYEYNYKKQAGCPGTYSNNLITEIFTKNNCTGDYIGSEVTFSIPAGKYTSAISQAEVDNLVENDLNINGQTYANTNGSCIPVYYNTVQSKVFQKENCGVGYVGGSYTYTVPARRYSSTIDLSTANQLALDEIDGNGWAYVNNNASVGCTIDPNPEWEAEEGASTRCQQDGYGLSTGHIEVYMTNVNPNTVTGSPNYNPAYGAKAWKDAGQDPSCPATCAFAINSSGGWTSPGNQSVSTNNGAVGFSFALTSPPNNPPTWTNWFTVGTIRGGCTPTAARTFDVPESGNGNTRIWTMTVDVYGGVALKLKSGPLPQPNNGQATTFTFSLIGSYTQ